MISGFNTDVRHRGLVLHVQTEDKGAENPCIESLVYVGGRIVSRRRSDYRELLDDGQGEAAVQRLMEGQHRDLIDCIRGGELDLQLTEMGALQAAEAEAAESAAVEGEEAGADGPSLDQVILDYLSTEADQEQLVLMMEAAGELRPGGSSLLVFEAKTSHGAEPVPETEVTVRVISTTKEPRELGRGTTDGEGALRLRIQIPDVEKGSAALIIHATSPVGGAEIKHLI